MLVRATCVVVLLEVVVSSIYFILLLLFLCAISVSSSLLVKRKVQLLDKIRVPNYKLKSEGYMSRSMHLNYIHDKAFS